MTDYPSAPTGHHQYGADHPYFEWSPIPTRPTLRWPDGAQLAFGVLVILEHYEWVPPDDAYSLRSASGGLAALPPPDYLRMTHREYGHRVGVFRLLDLLERRGITPTVAMDALTAEHYPRLVEHCVERGCEFVAHGIAASRLITAKMTEEQEADVIATSIDVLERVTGVRPRGWFGPEGVESHRTPALVARAGLEYVLDWPNDEQPYAMTLGDDELTAVPMYLECDDEFALWHRRARLDRWAAANVAAAERLHDDGADTGRLMVLPLRPWLSGQPFRAPVVDSILEAIVDLPRVWTATTGQIAHAYRQG